MFPLKTRKFYMFVPLSERDTLKRFCENVHWQCSINLGGPHIWKGGIQHLLGPRTSMTTCVSPWLVWAAVVTLT